MLYFRVMMHDRFFSHGGSALSSILRNTVHRMGSSYVIQGSGGRGSNSWSNPFASRGGSGPAHSASSLLVSANNGLKFKGRQLLDQEGLSCLLIILFIDDPKINTTRLHRILRNLCYHAPTREWVVKSLLSILERSNDKQQQPQQQPQPTVEATELPPAAKIRKSANKLEAKNVDPRMTSPSWLNISMDAALGFRANVFQVTRTASSGGKKSNNAGNSNSTPSAISIHPGASAVVCRHTLEVLISLAKSFSAFFLPWKSEAASNSVNLDVTKNKSASTSVKANDFWETLMKLDQSCNNSNKKGKSVARSHSSVGSLKSEAEANSGEDEPATSFENSPFGQLLAMLANPVIRRNSVLTDKLLRLLSLISLGLSDILRNKFSNTDDSSSSEASKVRAITSEHVKLAVKVLTSKSCSEEGLEDVTALLLNLSFGPEPTRDVILGLLLQGAQELGSVVRQNIIELQSELKNLKGVGQPQEAAAEASSEPGASTSGGSEKKDKGAVIDRFTKEAVVISAPSKVKGGPELQLPSMNALTNKTSSQAFFLRVLKVIIQLREAALQAMKRDLLKQLNRAAAKKSSAAAAMPTVQETEESTPAAAASNAATEGSTESMEVVEDENDKKEPSLPSLSEQLELSQLWDTLSACLRDLADTPDHHAVLVLQATVEAFFLVHAAPTQPEDKKKVHQKETRQEQLAHIQEQTHFLGEAAKEAPAAASTSSPGGSATAGSSELPVDKEKFLAFAETHRTVLNQILRQSTVHLADGPFSVLVDHTRVLDFDIKRRYASLCTLGVFTIKLCTFTEIKFG